MQILRDSVLFDSIKRFHRFGAVALLGVGASSALAQVNYPIRPLRVVIQFAPGGSDVVARILTQKMAESLGQPFVIDNRPGGAGIVGASIVAKAAPDGYTVLFPTASFAVTAAFGKKLPYDSMRDFDPIGFIGSQPFLLSVHPTVPVNSLKELIALAKVKPINYASAGAGGIGHLTGELFNHMAGTRMTHVGYKGTGPMVTAMLAGEVHMGISNLSGTWMHVRAGKLRALAVTTLKRTPFAPEMPTVAELGLAGFESGTWYGLNGPRGMPAVAINTLNREMQAALKTDIKDKINALGVDLAPTSPQAFGEYFRGEVAKWAKIIKAADIRE